MRFQLVMIRFFMILLGLAVLSVPEGSATHAEECISLEMDTGYTYYACAAGEACVVRVGDRFLGGADNDYVCAGAEGVYQDGCLISEWDTGYTYFVCWDAPGCTVGVGYWFSGGDPEYVACVPKDITH